VKIYNKEFPIYCGYWDDPFNFDVGKYIKGCSSGGTGKITDIDVKNKYRDLYTKLP